MRLGRDTMSIHLQAQGQFLPSRCVCTRGYGPRNSVVAHTSFPRLNISHTRVSFDRESRVIKGAPVVSAFLCLANLRNICIDFKSARSAEASPRLRTCLEGKHHCTRRRYFLSDSAVGLINKRTGLNSHGCCTHALLWGLH